MNLVVNEAQGERLDAYLVAKLPELTRSQIQVLIKAGEITLNTRTVKPKQTVQEGDEISIHIPPPPSLELQPENIPLEVLYEDDHLIVINKTGGMVVHPAAGNQTGTLVHALLHHCKGQLAPIGGEDRPGIVHRLDKDTSGAIVVAKADAAHQHLVSQFSERQTTKLYLAVTQKTPVPARGRIQNQIGRHPINRQKMAVLPEPQGKSAVTDIETLHLTEDGAALVLCHIHTGRTHQIRVHLASLKACIMGDPIYSKRSQDPRPTERLYLHAWHLKIRHPNSGEMMTFCAPLPEAFTPWSHSVKEKLQEASDALQANRPPIPDPLLIP